MPHLTEETLNEYLDNVLSPAARAVADEHFAICTACTAELEALRALFAEIESLPEAALDGDLTTAVVARLGATRSSVPRIACWALAIQGLVALGLLVVPLSLLDLSALTLPPIPLTWPTLPSLPDLSGLVVLPSFSLHFDGSALLLALLVVSAGLLWLVGNGLLLLLPRVASLKRRTL